MYTPKLNGEILLRIVEMMALNGPPVLPAERYQPDSRFKKLKGHAMLPAIFAFCIWKLFVV